LYASKCERQIDTNYAIWLFTLEYLLIDEDIYNLMFQFNSSIFLAFENWFYFSVLSDQIRLVAIGKKGNSIRFSKPIMKIYFDNHISTLCVWYLLSGEVVYTVFISHIVGRNIKYTFGTNLLTL
jgi:hypothetical protein